MVDVVVVGAGHNGLVAACYLARAGLEVLVLEAQAVPGGGSRTEERTPGYRFDLHSLDATVESIASVGLEYQEMDGRRVRFFRSACTATENGSRWRTT